MKPKVRVVRFNGPSLAAFCWQQYPEMALFRANRMRLALEVPQHYCQNVIQFNWGMIMGKTRAILLVSTIVLGLGMPAIAEDCETREDDDCVIILPHGRQGAAVAEEQTASGTSSAAGAGGTTSAAGAGAVASGGVFGNGVPLQTIAPIGVGAMTLFVLLNSAGASRSAPMTGPAITAARGTF